MATTPTANNDRYFALAAHSYEVNGEQRTDWTTVGRAFPNNKGGFNVRLHCVPAARDGEVFLMIAKATAKDVATG